jgi:hypothetical protein
MDTDTLSHAVYGLGTFFWLFVCVFALVLSVLWILVPFAVFGIKGLLRRIARSLEHIEKQNLDLLAAWRDAPRAVEPLVYRDPATAAPVAVQERLDPLPPR